MDSSLEWVCDILTAYAPTQQFAAIAPDFAERIWRLVQCDGRLFVTVMTTANEGELTALGWLYRDDPTRAYRAVLDVLGNVAVDA